MIDAAEGRDGRELVDERLRAVRAEVRLPRTPEEARANLRYFEAQDYRVVVAGPLSRRSRRRDGRPRRACARPDGRSCGSRALRSR